MRIRPFIIIIMRPFLPTPGGSCGMPSAPILIRLITAGPGPSGPGGGGGGGAEADGPPGPAEPLAEPAGDPALAAESSSADSFNFGPPLPTTSAYIGSSLV